MENPQIALIFSIIIMSIFLIFILPFITYSMAFRRSKENEDPTAELEKPFFKEYREILNEKISRLIKIECEIVSIKSFDGLTLYARYYHTKDGAPLQIQCHGYRGNPLRDFSGGGLAALDNGYNVLMIYQRAHALSEGKTITFGENERIDLLDWVKYSICELDAEKIMLMGISMGGATVLMASELDLPNEVKCIVADCPYSSTEEIIKLVVKSRHLPPKLVYPFIKLGARLYGNFTPDLHSPREAVKNSRVPILLIHGKADKFVPEYMSRAIYDGAQDKVEYHTFEGAGHGMSFLSNPTVYKEILSNFANKHLH